ncbi:dihydroneopterin aldolase [Devosia sp. ZB163]|uniref:dihydroneopterin aldolase n=1 Tax=Devosia sp. ZB163 TaxID=3025938 RepID=UPI00235F99CB|nr:dihydroneopterin aldolase [Devosia sp. ZB163]MDC9824682.1 dihydroneopterin aldolase [Devosia sp. ZB163]
MTRDFAGDRITLSDLGFYAYHGVMPEEAVLGQRFHVDLVCGIDLLAAGRTDELSASVSYAEIYEVAKAAFEGRRFKLIEAVAQHVVDRLFEAFGPIQWIQIRVRKPSAPIPMASGEAAIELHRHRDDR